jgi:hypothetical protein
VPAAGHRRSACRNHKGVGLVRGYLPASGGGISKVSGLSIKVPSSFRRAKKFLPDTLILLVWPAKIVGFQGFREFEFLLGAEIQCRGRELRARRPLVALFPRPYPPRRAGGSSKGDWSPFEIASAEPNIKPPQRLARFQGSAEPISFPRLLSKNGFFDKLKEYYMTRISPTKVRKAPNRTL